MDPVEFLTRRIALQGVGLELWHFPLLFLVGILVAVVNSIAGGGSALSVPVLIFLGLPSAMANGTNRIGIFLGALTAVLGFRSRGIGNRSLLLRIGGPAALGSLVGSLFAVKLPERIFNPILAGVILFVTVMSVRRSLAAPGKPGTAKAGGTEGARKEPGPGALETGLKPFLAFFLTGFYGGFIQIGVGFVMIYVFGRFTRLGALEVNALKVAVAFLFTAVALLAFLSFGRIHWAAAAALSAGSALGGFWGARLQVRKGEGWVNGALLVIGISFSLKLLFDTFAP